MNDGHAKRNAAGIIASIIGGSALESGAEAKPPPTLVPVKPVARSKPGAST